MSEMFLQQAIRGTFIASTFWKSLSGPPLHCLLLCFSPLPVSYFPTKFLTPTTSHPPPPCFPQYSLTQPSCLPRELASPTTLLPCSPTTSLKLLFSISTYSCLSLLSGSAISIVTSNYPPILAKKKNL